jgi:hypothetical protein
LVNGVVDKGSLNFEIQFYDEVVSLACRYVGFPGDATWQGITTRLNNNFLAALDTEAPLHVEVLRPLHSGLMGQEDGGSMAATSIKASPSYTYPKEDPLHLIEEDASSSFVIHSNLAFERSNTSPALPTVQSIHEPLPSPPSLVNPLDNDATITPSMYSVSQHIDPGITNALSSKC